MGKTTAIEWTDATWNPFMGCTKVSPACANCYAERDMKRYGKNFNKITRTSDKTFFAPVNWKEPKKIFVCSWSDFFHPDILPTDRDEAINRVVLKCPQHTFLFLTKRPENFGKLTSRLSGGVVPKNVWIGTTVENQEMADKRIPELLKVNAAVRFVSIEPILGPIDIDRYLSGSMVNWVIVGGESGPAARPVNISWVRKLRDQCANNGVPFMFKQWGEWKGVTRDADARVRMKDDPSVHLWPDEGWESPVSLKVGRKKAGCNLDGKEHKEFPHEKGWLVQ